MTSRAFRDSVTFLGVVTANEHLLAVQRRFHILVQSSYVTYDDMTNGGRRKSIRYERDDQRSFAAACRQLADVIGQHVVGKLVFLEDTSTMPGVDIVFNSVRALKYTQDVGINFSNCSQTGGNPDVFVSNFARPRWLRLRLDDDAFRDFRWAFLGMDASRELRMITVSLSFRSKEQHEDALQSIRRTVLVRILGPGSELLTVLAKSS